jgi:hypothetical protein
VAKTHDNSLDRRIENLARIADLGGRRLTDRLEGIRADLDLDRGTLMAAQEDVLRLERIGAMPDLAEYWHRWAVPRADEFLSASLTAVLEEGQQLSVALDDMAAAMGGPTRSGPGSWTVTYPDAERTAAEAAGHLRNAVPDPAPIHDVGLWWQRRLRRAARRRAMPHLLTPGSDADQLIGKAEMSLLDSPPWCHGDRLLLAFELAHAEIRKRADLVADAVGGQLCGYATSLTDLDRSSDDMSVDLDARSKTTASHRDDGPGWVGAPVIDLN